MLHPFLYFHPYICNYFRIQFLSSNSAITLHIRTCRCQIPSNSDVNTSMELLLSWLLVHREDITEELEQIEQERDREQEDSHTVRVVYMKVYLFQHNIIQLAQEQSEHTTAAVEHAPDLLEGPTEDQHGECA